MFHPSPEPTSERPLAAAPLPTDLLAALHATSRRALAGQPETLVADVLDRCCDVLDASAGLVLLLASGDSLTLGPAVRLRDGLTTDRADRPPFASIMRNARPVVVSLRSDRLAEPLPSLGRLGFTHAVVAPLPATADGHLYGFGIFCFRQVPAAHLLAAVPMLSDQLALAGRLANVEASNCALQAAIAHQRNVQELFLSAVSHELKGPLTNMQGYSQLVLRYPDAPPGQRQRNLETILAETRRLTRLVNELTTAARLENGSLEMAIEPVELASLVHEIVDHIRGLPASSQRIVVVEAPAALPPGQWDRDRLAEALGSLVEQAIGESPPEGDVVVFVEQDGDDAVVRVQSSGHPADSEALRLAFVPFYRLAKPARIKGVGLGLSISRLIVEALGGCLWAEPTADRGNLYGIRLPFRGSGIVG